MASKGSTVLRSQELNLVLGPMGFQLRASWENFAIHTQGTKTRQETYAKDQKKGELKRTYIHSIAEARGKVDLYKSCGKSISRISGLPDLRSGQHLSSLGPTISFHKESIALQDFNLKDFR